METPTQPLAAKIGTQAPSDEPSLGIALWTLAGFILFAAIIFLLVIYRPL